jgi:hypothetical protein
MGKKIKRLGTMRFELDDYTDSEFNESVDCTYALYGTEVSGQIMSIEQYYCLCKQFAAAMGFAEKTINDWFGEY